MPSILEQVQPSWIEDGWGIQGDQNEVRFDDDIPWDITAWTRDNQAEDSDQLCCNPLVCPCIEFSDVGFCCIEDVNNEYYEDIGTNPFAVLNGRPFCLAGGDIGLCVFCTNDDDCDGSINFGGLTLFARDCDTHAPAGSATISLDVATIAGVRYVLAYPGSSPTGGVFYWGTTAGNEIVSCGGTINIDGPFTDCVYGGPIGDLPIIGFGGTVSVAPCPPLGACCVEGFDCFTSPEGYCNNVGGTYEGDGVPCVPDPC